MGSDDLFKKRREARKKRSHEFKTPKANSYLGFIGINGKTDCIQCKQRGEMQIMGLEKVLKFIKKQRVSFICSVNENGCQM